MKGERLDNSAGEEYGRDKHYELKHTRARMRKEGGMVGKVIEMLGGERRLFKKLGTAIIGKSNIDKDNIRPCEDKLFVDRRKNIFAVFDGMGGDFGGGEASKTAALAMGEILDYMDPKTSEDLGQVLTRVAHRVDRNRKAGATTGVVGRIVKTKSGKKKLIYANVGDSRIYLVNGDKATQITQDEGLGHNIWNALGLDYFEVKQKGEIELKDGDRLVFCTDGVTGDTEYDCMTDEEIAEIVSRAKKSKKAARSLIRQAKKIDDRTAIVVEV